MLWTGLVDKLFRNYSSITNLKWVPALLTNIPWSSPPQRIRLYTSSCFNYYIPDYQCTTHQATTLYSRYWMIFSICRLHPSLYHVWFGVHTDCLYMHVWFGVNLSAFRKSNRHFSHSVICRISFLSSVTCTCKYQLIRIFFKNHN